jgi:hypothetical protein
MSEFSGAPMPHRNWALKRWDPVVPIWDLAEPKGLEGVAVGHLPRKKARLRQAENGLDTDSSRPLIFIKLR